MSEPTPSISLLVRAEAKIKRNKYGATRSAGDYRSLNHQRRRHTSVPNITSKKRFGSWCGLEDRQGWHIEHSAMAITKMLCLNDVRPEARRSVESWALKVGERARGRGRETT